MKYKYRKSVLVYLAQCHFIILFLIWSNVKLVDAQLSNLFDLSSWFPPQPCKGNSVSKLRSAQTPTMDWLFPSRKSVIINKDYPYNGHCRNAQQCDQLGGMSDGSCALGLGVCCILMSACKSTINNNQSYFANPEYPAIAHNHSCSVSILPLSTNVEQIKLEFLYFHLHQPNHLGECIQDYFIIENSISSISNVKICGINHDQHLYIPFKSNKEPIVLKIVTNGSYESRRWMIKIFQIESTNELKAPTGCNQYFTDGKKGIVASFNKFLLSNKLVFKSRNIHLLKYAICIRLEADYCSIEMKFIDTSIRAFDFNSSSDSNYTHFGLLNSNSKTDFAFVRAPLKKPSQINLMHQQSFNARLCNNLDMISFTPELFRPYLFCGDLGKLGILRLRTHPVVIYVSNTGIRAGNGFAFNYKQLPCY